MLPDIEALAIDHLTDAAVAAGGVHDSFPVNPTYPLIRVVRLGGVPSEPRWLDTATLQIDVWGSSKAEARDTAATALASLTNMEGTIDTGEVTGVVTGVTVNQGLLWLPDGITEKPRYNFTVSVNAHP